MEKLQFTAKTRELKETPSSVRSSGFIPAELYGHNVANVHLKLSRGDFEKLFRKAGESTLIDLSIEGNGNRNVLVHEVQRHFATSQILHVDLLEVSMTEKLTTEVAVEFIGESNAVKALGGTLVKVISTVEIECLPADLPHNLEVDISTLNTFEDTIYVKNITAPKGVTILTDAEETVAMVQPPRDVEAELATPIVEDVESVGTVEKKAEEEEPAPEAAE